MMWHRSRRYLLLNLDCFQRWKFPELDPVAKCCNFNIKQHIWRKKFFLKRVRPYLPILTENVHFIAFFNWNIAPRKLGKIDYCFLSESSNYQNNWEPVTMATTDFRQEKFSETCFLPKYFTYSKYHRNPWYRHSKYMENESLFSANAS